MIENKLKQFKTDGMTLEDSQLMDKMLYDYRDSRDSMQILAQKLAIMATDTTAGDGT